MGEMEIMEILLFAALLGRAPDTPRMVLSSPQWDTTPVLVGPRTRVFSQTITALSCAMHASYLHHQQQQQD